MIVQEQKIQDKVKAVRGKVKGMTVCRRVLTGGRTRVLVSSFKDFQVGEKLGEGHVVFLSLLCQSNMKIHKIIVFGNANVYL